MLRKKTDQPRECLGRSAGGLSTKIHVLVDALGNPMAVHLSPGNAHDLEGADVPLPQLKSDVLLADKGYDAQQRVAAALQSLGKTAVIPSRSNCLQPRSYDRHPYASRHLIENFFAKLKQYRAIATRYDKRASLFLSAIQLAASIILLN